MKIQIQVIKADNNKFDYEDALKTYLDANLNSGNYKKTIESVDSLLEAYCKFSQYTLKIHKYKKGRLYLISTHKLVTQLVSFEGLLE